MECTPVVIVCTSVGKPVKEIDKTAFRSQAFLEGTKANKTPKNSSQEPGVRPF